MVEAVLDPHASISHTLGLQASMPFPVTMPLKFFLLLHCSLTVFFYCFKFFEASNLAFVCASVSNIMSGGFWIIETVKW